MISDFKMMKMPSISVQTFYSVLLAGMQVSASAAIVLTIQSVEFTFWKVVTAALGVGLWTWAIVTMKVSRVSIRPEVSGQAELITAGPFRWLRHPMYSGLALFLLPCVFSPFHMWRFLLWLILLGVLVAKASLEERLLAEQFSGYADYRRRTNRFVPFLF